jgi:putative flippase GtrA
MPMSASLVRFALVGLAGTLVYFALLWVMVELLQWPVMHATCCAFLLVVVENYLLHRSWTFHSAAPHAQALPGFLLVSMLGFCVNGAVMAVGAQRYGLNYLAVQAVAIGAVVVCNYIGARWIFGRGERGTLMERRRA